MAFKRKDEHFNDFGYQQENISNQIPQILSEIWVQCLEISMKFFKNSTSLKKKNNAHQRSIEFT